MKKIAPKSGDPYIWLTGGALAFCLLMVIGMIGLILVNGLGVFWPTDLARVTTRDGGVILGQIKERELSAEQSGEATYRIKIKRANRDIDTADYLWVEEKDIVDRSSPADQFVIERREWGDFFGSVKSVKEGEEVSAEGAEALGAVAQRLPEAKRAQEKIASIERKEVGDISYAQERLRLKSARLERQGVVEGPELEAIEVEKAELQKRYDAQIARIDELKQNLQTTVVLAAIDGAEKEVPIGNIIRWYQPNVMSVASKLQLYTSKLWEFISDDPRESNTEGGTFPAIFGTVMMVMLMTFIVTPFGVIAAVYLREYARQGKIVSAVRIAVNNLAGVPSIVFGVFGVGFFIYFIG
ncbi:MAG TPA: phosphate ABC transporter, permease protein PstA, partial [Blastocatellia bacterium]|nr:phosphate ABC transporter, permease protein PstA [Blastocatellia bacterium]